MSSGNSPTTVKHYSSAKVKQFQNYRSNQYMSYRQFNIAELLLIFISYILLIVTFPFSLFLSLKVIPEYQRAVIFRLGKVAYKNAQGPGIIFIIPCIDYIVMADLRTQIFELTGLHLITKDSVSFKIEGVVCVRIFNPVISVEKIRNLQYAIKLNARAVIIKVLGTKTLMEIQQGRNALSAELADTLNDMTVRWGARIEKFELRDVELPEKMQRAMASEAESTRESRAKVILSEGEKNASHALKEAADVLNKSPCALNLKYMNSLSAVVNDNQATTLLFPFPLDFSMYTRDDRPKQHTNFTSNQTHRHFNEL